MREHGSRHLPSARELDMIGRLKDYAPGEAEMIFFKVISMVRSHIGAWRIEPWALESK